MIVKWKDQNICQRMKYAESFSDRLLGLMFRNDMNDFDGLMLKYEGFFMPPFASIHTFFMRFSIDAIFLNKNNEVLKIYRNLSPWKMTRSVWGASQILEMRANSIPVEMKKGDRLELCIN